MQKQLQLPMAFRVLTSCYSILTPRDLALSYFLDPMVLYTLLTMLDPPCHPL